MGAGITQVIAQAGIKVIANDRTEADLERGKKQIQKGIRKKSEEEQQTILENITFTTSMEDGKDSDLVIEAVPEKLEIKKDVFALLDQFMKPEAILATNTSSLSIAAISSATERPEKVIGLHFFSPVPIMKLLEIVKGINTGEETVEFGNMFAEQIGKKVIVANDFPGFTVNRVLVPMLNEAAFLVMEGNDPEEVDRGMMLGANHPIGPLKLADMVGVDVLLHTLESLYEGFNDSKYRPCPVLKRMVEAGHLGKKSGQGFYQY
ncbi:3-hydroxybutyryl-CoA dehydrogenase [Salinibacillus xinjiangensis]|uniref:3-hydroxybutyryl-CoA dehydrogenase n=2 Tax=Salinibacillus xinjiangensis TaxID=1229268 RepID=A0A6G1X9W6_9BACI|nr:3-hydroxybutyryl-CoA dehydrogenase [Salinibacillus xinjiangensis]